MSQQNTQLCQVLEYLKKTYHLSQGMIADALNQIPTCTGMTSAKLTHYKTLYIRELPLEIITALHDLYNINPDYLTGNSEVMLDYAQIELEAISVFVKNWRTISKTYQNSKKEQHTVKCLLLSMKSSFCDLLHNTSHAKLLEKAGMKSYDEEFQKHKAIYNERHNTKNVKESAKNDSENVDECYEEYVLIPKKAFFKIISAERSNETLLKKLGTDEWDNAELDELIDYSEYYPLLDQ